MLSTCLLYWKEPCWSGTCCRYSRMRLVGISSREVANVVPMLANCVVLVAATSVERNTTWMVSSSCMVDESWFGSEVDKELLPEREVGPL